jgi:MinD superfamily P-loop ATPase
VDLVVLSGKGGTGKTTIVAALSELAGEIMQVDADVDAPNLYLFYNGTDIEKKEFYGGKKAKIDPDKCAECGICEAVCKFGAIKNKKIDSFVCEGCGACTLVCPQDAIALVEEKTADTFIRKTEKGIISRARMEIGSDGSGKLVTDLRKNAKTFTKDSQTTIIDGSPGIGCTVIASMTGTDATLIVTEPTKSGLEDLRRILNLAESFDTFVMVCINKYDINLEVTGEIEEYTKEKNKYIVGKIPFDKQVMESVNQLKPITEFENSKALKAIKEMWIRISELLQEVEIK